MPTSTAEDYLKAIRHLEERDGAPVALGKIADALEVTAGTVTTMMRGLSEAKLVEYAPRKGVKLRKSGREAALRVVRRHRIVELFLVEVMELDWSEVHHEAEVLEHVVSDRVLERMDEMLGFPTHDPHGDPIPARNGHMPVESGLPLSERASGHFDVTRIADSDPPFLDWVQGAGLRPGEPVEVLSCDRISGVMELKCGGHARPVRIAVSSAERILVVEASTRGRRHRQ